MEKREEWSGAVLTHGERSTSLEASCEAQGQRELTWARRMPCMAPAMMAAPCQPLRSPTTSMRPSANTGVDAGESTAAARLESLRGGLPSPLRTLFLTRSLARCAFARTARARALTLPHRSRPAL
jgi:hypothetical protein